MSERSTFYITTPIYYINSKPHIGHSYTTIAADAMARYHRLLGHDVFFLTGTDEHGQKVARAAQAAGKTPQQWADEVSAEFRSLWKLLLISNDDFIRTTEDRHERRVQLAIKRMIENGDVYPGDYEGWYCVPCETFWPENQLVEGACPDCRRPVERLREPTYFFRLSKYTPWLVDHIEAHPDFVQPEVRRNEILSRLRRGVNDLSITRATLSWGIPAPVPENHTIYVWVDALFNYITALEFDRPDGPFSRYWPADFHFIGKEILWFHAAIWPCMLKSLDLPLPRCVFAHGWWVFGKDLQKISKSTGNIVDPVDLLERVGVDALRYFLLRQTPFGLDGQFTYQGLVERTNTDLANDLGNLLHRTQGMVKRYFAGRLPRPNGPAREVDAELRAVADELPRKVDREMRCCQFSLALEAVWELVRAANQYVERNQPWVLAKDEGERPRLAVVLYNLAEVCRLLSVWLEPFMPRASREIRRRLGLKPEAGGTLPEIARWGGMPPETSLQGGPPLFPRVEVEDL